MKYFSWITDKKQIHNIYNFFFVTTSHISDFKIVHVSCNPFSNEELTLSSEKRDHESRIYWEKWYIYRTKLMNNFVQDLNSSHQFVTLRDICWTVVPIFKWSWVMELGVLIHDFYWQERDISKQNPKVTEFRIKTSENKDHFYTI